MIRIDKGIAQPAPRDFCSCGKTKSVNAHRCNVCAYDHRLKQQKAWSKAHREKLGHWPKRPSKKEVRA